MATLFGTRALLGTQGLAYLLLAVTLLLYVADVVFHEEDRRRNRDRSRNTGTDPRLLIVVFGLVLVFGATAAMVAPAGPQESASSVRSSTRKVRGSSRPARRKRRPIPLAMAALFRSSRTSRPAVMGWRSNRTGCGSIQKRRRTPPLHCQHLQKLVTIAGTSSNIGTWRFYPIRSSTPCIASIRGRHCSPSMPSSLPPSLPSVSPSSVGAGFVIDPEVGGGSGRDFSDGWVRGARPAFPHQRTPERTTMNRNTNP